MGNYDEFGQKNAVKRLGKKRVYRGDRKIYRGERKNYRRCRLKFSGERLKKPSQTGSQRCENKILGQWI